MATPGTAALLVLLVLSGCATIQPDHARETCPPVVARAIAVRGGPITSLRRTTNMRVYFGFPGLWHLEYTFVAPRLYRWTVFTTGEPNHYTWDGSTMRAWIGPMAVGSDTSGNAPLRSHARWHAVTYLDTLCSGNLDVHFRSLPPEPGGGQTVVARLLDDDSEYTLVFDRHARPLRVSGPIDIPPFGKARLTQSFFDFRRSGRFFIPHTTRYEIDGTTLSDEVTTSFFANDPAIERELLRQLEMPLIAPDAGARRSRLDRRSPTSAARYRPTPYILAHRR